MNEQILPHDSNIKLSPDDVAALADAQAMLDRITAASPETRLKIETLQQEELAAKAQAAIADAGTRGASRKAHFLRIRITEKLERARRAAVKDFARPRGWRYEGPLSASELHTESLWMTWCETCGGLCQQTEREQHSGGNSHTSGKHDAFRYRTNAWKTEAVVHHTRHPLEACQVFAARFGLKVTQLDWSWYGLPRAVMFERGGRR